MLQLLRGGLALTGLFWLILGGIMGYQRQEPSAAYLMLWQNDQGEQYITLPDGSVHRRLPVGVTAQVSWIGGEPDELYIMYRRALYRLPINSSRLRLLVDRVANTYMYNIYQDEAGNLLLPLERNSLRHLYQVSPDGEIINFTPDLIGEVMTNSLMWGWDYLVFRACQGTGACIYYQMQLDGTGLTPLLNPPDGYVYACGGTATVRLFCGEGRDPRQYYLLDHTQAAFEPLPAGISSMVYDVWQFDGETITYLDIRGRIVRSALDGTSDHILAQLPLLGERLYLPADPGLIYYKTFEDETLSINEINTATSENRVVFVMDKVQDTMAYGRLDEQSILVGVSPADGDHLAIYQLHLTTGAITPFIQLPAVGQGYFTPLPDPDWLLVSVYDSVTYDQLRFRVRRDGQVVENLAVQGQVLSNISPLIDLPYQAGIPLASGGLLIILAFVLVRRWVV